MTLTPYDNDNDNHDDDFSEDNDNNDDDDLYLSHNRRIYKVSVGINGFLVAIWTAAIQVIFKRRMIKIKT